MTGTGDPREAAARFCRDAGTCRIEPLGSGNINDTFVVHSSAGPFVLQKINGSVFPEPLRVIRNFEKITRHLLDGRQKRGIAFQTAEPVRTLTGELFSRDCRGEFWRGQTCLATPDRHNLSGLERIGRAGRTLALFHLLAADLDVAILEEPLPGFHNLPGYMAEFDRVLTVQRRMSGKEIDYCLESIERIRPQTTLLEDAEKAGILMIQPIHGDPKIDNFIFGDPGEADGMMDFDTVGAGLIHYDLGDCLRSCCNRAGESGQGTESVSLDLEYCRALLDGYISCAPQLLDGRQRGYIFEAVLLIAFELGLRFFTDHLRGNRYFKTAYEGENLQRAVRQFQLVADIAGKEKEIRLIAG
jgi:Ser/Thr protein kinase RdoA (MazF antagonist)